LAYIIIAHKAPAQVARLVHRLCADSLVLLHYDAAASPCEYRQLCDLLAAMPNLVLLPRHRVHWGRYGMVEAIVEGIHYLVETEYDYDTCLLLSGQDYPIKSQEKIMAFLATRPQAIFLSHSWMDGPSEQWRMRRLDHWYFMPFGNSFKFPNKYIDRVIRIRRRIPQGLQLYSGSSWWAIPRYAIEYLYQFSLLHPDFFAFFRHAANPEEYIPQIILMNSPLRDAVLDDDLHYTEWPLTGRRNSPFLLSTRDLPKLLGSEKLFARKFDAAVDAHVLDCLDEAIGWRAGALSPR
jgi:hypothetical protein